MKDNVSTLVLPKLGTARSFKKGVLRFVNSKLLVEVINGPLFLPSVIMLTQYATKRIIQY